jgi:hypothetical protein
MKNGIGLSHTDAAADPIPHQLSRPKNIAPSGDAGRGAEGVNAQDELATVFLLVLFDRFFGRILPLTGNFEFAGELRFFVPRYCR